MSGGRLDTYLETVLNGLVEATAALDCNVLIATGVARENTLSATAWPSIREHQRFTPVGPWNTDGIVVINPLWSDAAAADVAQWQAEGFPVALIGRGCDGPTIVADNYGGIVSAVEHLVEHGHRRIAFLSANAGDGPERQRAYEDTVARLGLDADPRLLADAAHEPVGGRRAIDEILDSGVGFTAVLASNESSGRGALERLKEQGFAIPGDVAVVGYDDFLEALATDPAMTCVRQPIDGVARRAVELLLGQIRETAEPEQLSLVPTTLSARESCGCAPSYDGPTAERGRRALARRIVHDAQLAYAMETFTSKLVGIAQLDMIQLGRVLLQTAPGLGFRRAFVGVYESDEDDPVAWTISEPDADERLVRFPTRAFPPPELTCPDEPFRFMVIPLHLHEEKGFLALTTESLPLCVAIAARAETAFESARNQLAREAAEASLAESEDQLRQAQKMDAVGRLAGGIAHDFNNLLTAISGYAEIVLRDIETRELDPERLREQVGMISSASDRAASLTRQLLAFSRRQIMQPVVLDANEVIDDAQSLLSRLVGEDVVLAVTLTAEAARIRADRNQLEQVVMNLALNAREAMPNGGSVSLATATVVVEPGQLLLAPGEYVTVTVADTGVGIDEATQSKIFEPFFTTKEQGTGLGLATAYGIVKQSGGEILVESAPGQGATFTVYLPRVDEAVVQEAEPEASDGAAISASILLVEDEAGVRQYVAEVLRHHGLEVLEAADAAEALLLSHGRTESIDILLTDVVMPEMNGRELARQLVAERPGLRVLFISGYAEEAIFDDYEIAPSTAFLAKPFSGDALLHAIGELLAEAAPQA